MTCQTSPIVTSDALIGRFVGSVCRRVPFFHIVCLNLRTSQFSPTLPISGTRMDRGKRARAVTPAPTSAPRRVRPESSAPSLSIWTAISRVSSEERSSCRSSTCSRLLMRTLM